MDKNIQKKVIDITGVELTPGEPTVCLGNGDQGFECCYDESTTFCFVFLNLTPKIKERNIAENKVYYAGNGTCPPAGGAVVRL